MITRSIPARDAEADHRQLYSLAFEPAAWRWILTAARRGSMPISGLRQIATGEDLPALCAFRSFWLPKSAYTGL